MAAVAATWGADVRVKRLTLATWVWLQLLLPWLLNVGNEVKALVTWVWLLLLLPGLLNVGNEIKALVTWVYCKLSMLMSVLTLPGFSYVAAAQ